MGLWLKAEPFLRLCAAQVQSLLETLATGVERVEALCTWADPTATQLALLALLVLAALLWLVGLPALIAALLLFDIRCEHSLGN
jgi:hypothetical protein